LKAFQAVHEEMHSVVHLTKGNPCSTERKRVVRSLQL
jgi:hypothetical protein